MKISAQEKIAELESRISELEREAEFHWGVSFAPCAPRNPKKNRVFGEHWKNIWREFDLLFKEAFGRQMGLSCLRYKAYDWAKQRWLTQKLFYRGLPYRHYDTVSISGTVIDCAHKSADGDVDFDLQAEAPAYLVALSKRWHLECTPCQPDALRAQIAGLKIGQRITVTGTRTFDNDHHIFAWKFGGGHWEVHPVTNIKEET